MRGPGSPASFLFRLIIPLTALFVITILALIATLFGDERAPFPHLVNEYGNLALTLEFVAIVVVTGLAIGQDQRRIREAGEQEQSTVTTAAAEEVAAAVSAGNSQNESGGPSDG